MKLRNIFRLVEPIPFIIILVVALPFICIGISEAMKAHAVVENFMEEHGVIVGNDYLSTVDLQDNDKESWAYYPVVRFEIGEGREYVFTDGIGTFPAEYDEGEVVEVLYNPDDPRDATINNWKRLWFGPLWIIAIGLLPIIGLVGWIVWQYVRSERMLKNSRNARKR
ncbi:MAG: DUF3592 domain-containing protein [Anaerolineales bacterium]|nr:DUF3592 domain-containing protein [Anaerolineales bacterium]